MPPYIDTSQSLTERLLEGSWERRERRAPQRELLVDALAAVLFVMAAATLLELGGAAGLRPGLAILLIVVYAIVARIEFPVGAGYVVPTQLVLIPMLMLLPPGIVPTAVAIGLFAGNAIACALGRIAPCRVLSAVPDSWHAIGPAIVLLLAGSPTIGFSELPLLVLAFAAGCLVDMVGSSIRTRLAGIVPELKMQMRVIALVWAVDVALAPLGFLAGTATRENRFAILFVLPLVFQLALLARERSRRIDQAHQRLKLVEQERGRLQSAVRLLGDAFAAKLELDGLLEILLQGSVEALDAAAGRLELAYGRPSLTLVSGPDEWVERLGSEAPRPNSSSGPIQLGRPGVWLLSIPMVLAASHREITGRVSLLREGRAFEPVEIALVSELIAKAQLSAADIIAHHAIREQAMTDPLTGLGNRRRLGADLSRSFADGTAAKPSLLLLFDLDGFKEYNDRFGHMAGDALLARLGGKLQGAVNGYGRAYRLGGDEFCAHVDLKGVDADRLILRIAAALTETGGEFTIQASMGVVLLPHETDSAEDALQTADERMYANKRSRSRSARSQTGEVLLRTMHAKQPELDEHASNVSVLAAKVGRRLGLSAEELEDVSRAAQLHDVGKVGIPDAILHKSSGLSDSEWEFIHNHTILGERILHGAPALRSVARLVRASHERWDGSGYPDRLCGQEIPLGARIVSVCDAYEAMMTERSFRPAVPHDTACQELLRCAGTQFDPAVVEAFIAAVRTHGDEREPDAAQDAAAHVRTLLGAGTAGVLAR